MDKAPRGEEWLVPYYGTYDRRDGSVYLFCWVGTAEDFLKVFRPMVDWARGKGGRDDPLVLEPVAAGQAPFEGEERRPYAPGTASDAGGHMAGAGGPDEAAPMELKEALPGGAGQSLSENLSKFSK